MNLQNISGSQYPLTSYQENFIDALLSSGNNISLNAGPGTGKTYSLNLSANALINSGLSKNRIKAVAFNSSIAAEGNNSLPVDFWTMHKFGLDMLRERASWINTNRNLKKSKIYFGVKYFVQHRADFYNLSYSDSTEMYLLIKILSDQVSRFRTTFPTKDTVVEEDYEVVLQTAKEVKGKNAHAAFFIVRDIIELLHDSYKNFGNYASLRTFAEDRLDERIKKSYEKLWLVSIDFEEMLILPLVWNVAPPEIDVLLVDEIQDLNGLQIQFIQHLNAQRYILVGDPDQAIYGFAGAFTDSFDRVVNAMDAKVLPLSLNFRSLPKIVELAQDIKPELEPFRKGEGIVENIRYSDCIDLAQPGDLILSRFNKDLFATFIRLLSQGKAARILGKQNHTIITNTIKAATEWGRRDFKRVYEDLNDAKEEKILKAATMLDGPDFEDEHQQIIDEFDLIFSIVENSGATSYNSLFEYIEEIFSQAEEGDDNCIILSTIHKAKGLEFDRVFVLRYDEMPFAFKGQSDDDQKQELNLLFVAITRAKDELYLVEMPRNSE